MRKPIAILIPTGLLALSTLAAACVLVDRPVMVGRQFRLQVSDHEFPVKGLHIRMTDVSSHDTDFVTDRNGSVNFDGLAPGTHWVSAVQDDGYGSTLHLEVSDNEPPGKAVQIRWPSVTPIRVRTVSGILRGSRGPGVSISLYEGLSARMLQTGKTDEQGQFAFSNVREGLYFLGVAWNMRWPKFVERIEGRVAIQVDHSADQEALDLDLNWSDCGLNYVDLNKNRQPELRVTRLCGVVVDSVGAAISKADISLVDRNSFSTILNRTQSNSSGHFALNQSDGQYQLVVQSRGFFPLRTLVQIHDSVRSSECSKPVYVELGVDTSGKVEVLANP